MIIDFRKRISTGYYGNAVKVLEEIASKCDAFEGYDDSEETISERLLDTVESVKFSRLVNSDAPSEFSDEERDKLGKMYKMFSEGMGYDMTIKKGVGKLVTPDKMIFIYHLDNEAVCFRVNGSRKGVSITNGDDIDFINHLIVCTFVGTTIE